MGNKVNDKAWDIGFHKEIGDESNPTYSIVIGGTSNALHLIDPLNAGTDFNVSADTRPALYIHGSAAAVTEYVKIFTDETDAHLNVVGANLDIDIPTGGSVSIQVNNTDEYEFSATTLNMQSNNIGSIGSAVFLGAVNFSNGAISSAGTTTFLGQINAGSQVINGAGNLIFVTGRTITGTALVINGAGTAMKLSNAASWVANSTAIVDFGTTGASGLGTTVQEWITVLNAAGSERYIPCWGK